MAEIIFEQREEPPFPLHLQRKSLHVRSGFILRSRPLANQVCTSWDSKRRRIPPVHGLVPSPFQIHRFPKQPYSPEVCREKKCSTEGQEPDTLEFYKTLRDRKTGMEGEEGKLFPIVLLLSKSSCLLSQTTTKL